jgi:CheY-like chemotaxis protein
VEVDQGQIEQVMLNLYVNAGQAMPGGGELFLRTENVFLDDDYVKALHARPGHYVKISVEDNGVGMDEATRRRIFEPFFTTKEMGRGTGLGLASVYGIIKNHFGIIDVHSIKGEGTTFEIFLPASEKKVIRERTASEGMSQGHETVLLVDDEDMILDVGSQMLEKLGYRVITAHSGNQTLETYKKNQDRIDAVILDIIMPEMGGAETFDKLKALNPDVRVLLSSGYSIHGHATDILNRGCTGFIQKPFKIEDLSQKLREVFDAQMPG